MNNNESLLYYTSIHDTVDVVWHNKINTSYPAHTHAEHYIVGLVMDGEILIETHTNKYVCKSGNIFIIPIDTYHSIKTVHDCFYTMLSLCIHEDYFIHTNINDIKVMIDRKLKRIFHENIPIDVYSELFTNGLTLLLASKLKHFTDESYAIELKHKLVKVPELSFSVEDMSREVYVSSFHMIRQFKKEVGLTPHQFQIQCRIRKAQKMLLSDMTIAEVALDTGFCDQSHFIKCFKKIVGIAPSSYKKVAMFSKEQE